MDNKENRNTAMHDEWMRLKRQEDRFLSGRLEKKDTKLNQLLEDKVPAKLQNTLDVAFAKAFSLIFEKGTGVIELTYNKKKIKNKFKMSDRADRVYRDSKSIKSFSKRAGGSHAVNLSFSGVSGIGMGVLGIGLPDIPVFTATLLKGIYEIAMHYGFEYESEPEKYFILRLISGAVSYGDELKDINQSINRFVEEEKLPEDYQRKKYIDKAANSLSKELLYMKFLQGIPIVGAVGGAYNVIYMQQVLTYADIKYRRRFNLGRE